MKTDKYTKSVLTIIAVCLTILTLQSIDIIPKAYASEESPNLKTEPSTSIGNNYAIVPLNSDGSIDVNVKSISSEMDVNITGISTKDELDVNIDEVGGGYVSHGGPISVEVE